MTLPQAQSSDRAVEAKAKALRHELEELENLETFARLDGHCAAQMTDLHLACSSLRRVIDHLEGLPTFVGNAIQ